MASSKDKAVGLKDAYVAGLLDSAGPEVAAEAGSGAMQELAGKLGMEQGQQASVVVDLRSGEAWGNNDGDPTFKVTSDWGGSNARTKTRQIEAARYPNAGKPFNHVDNRKLSERELRQFASELY